MEHDKMVSFSINQNKENKMFTKKVMLRILVIAVVLSLALSACGEAAVETPVATEAPAVVATEAPAECRKRQRIRSSLCTELQIC